MFATNLIAGLIGLALLAGFLGTMLWWVKAIPLTIIMLVVGALIVYDIIKTLRQGDGASGG
jgi:hypothetical protein